jgi:hypothetical protein
MNLLRWAQVILALNMEKDHFKYLLRTIIGPWTMNLGNCALEEENASRRDSSSCDFPHCVLNSQLSSFLHSLSFPSFPSLYFVFHAFLSSQFLSSFFHRCALFHFFSSSGLLNEWMNEWIRGGPSWPLHCDHSDLLCLPFWLSPQQSCTSNEAQDLVRGDVEIVTWFHKILTQVAQS